MTKMRVSLLCSFVLGLALGQSYARDATAVTTCQLQQQSEKFLSKVVEIRSMIIINGGHVSFIHDNDCRFVFAFGDDYQTFGTDYPAKQDAQWKMMRNILSHSVCANNARAVKGKFVGTVSRIPATGTIPPNEMGIELVIQSVSEVEAVPIRCTPRAKS